MGSHHLLRDEQAKPEARGTHATRVPLAAPKRVKQMRN